MLLMTIMLTVVIGGRDDEFVLRFILPFHTCAGVLRTVRRSGQVLADLQRALYLRQHRLFGHRGTRSRPVSDLGIAANTHISFV
jgi:hypothetical protein